jgi:hypothetical protein
MRMWPIGALTVALCSSALAATQDAGAVVAFIDFYKRWDTPEQDRATETFRKALRDVNDYEAFRRSAPPGSDTRRYFLMHLDSFEDAARLIRAGKLREDLMYEGWYAMPDNWTLAASYVAGIRKETGDAKLYADTEWLAARAASYWAEQTQHPTTWQPIERPPNAGDRTIQSAFDSLWSTPRDTIARAYFDDVTRRARTPEDFMREAPPGSAEYTKLDRVLCAYDLAGELIKFGAMNPATFFGSWQSPKEIWSAGGAWVLGLRAMSPSASGYDSAEWLVHYETEWRGKYPAAAASH